MHFSNHLNEAVYLLKSIGQCWVEKYLYKNLFHRFLKITHVNCRERGEDRKIGNGQKFTWNPSANCQIMFQSVKFFMQNCESFHRRFFHRLIKQRDLKQVEHILHFRKWKTLHNSHQLRPWHGKVQSQKTSTGWCVPRFECLAMSNTSLLPSTKRLRVNRLCRNHCRRVLALDAVDLVERTQLIYALAYQNRRFLTGMVFLCWKHFFI